MPAERQDSDGQAATGDPVSGSSVPRPVLDAVDSGLATFDLTVLPMESSDAGFWVYHEAAIDLVRDLKAAGVDAGYAHPADSRRYYSERSAEIAVSFLVSLGSAAVWEAFMRALQRYRGRQKLSVTVVDERQPNGSERRTATFDGSGEDVLSAMRVYQDNQGTT